MFPLIAVLNHRNNKQINWFRSWIVRNLKFWILISIFAVLVAFLESWTYLDRYLYAYKKLFFRKNYSLYLTTLETCAELSRTQLNRWFFIILNSYFEFWTLTFFFNLHMFITLTYMFSVWKPFFRNPFLKNISLEQNYFLLAGLFLES